MRAVRSALLILTLAAAPLAGVARAQSTGAVPTVARAPASPGPKIAPKKKPKAGSKPGSKAASAGKGGSARARTAKDAAPGPAQTAGVPRTLQDIHIEGEIPVPQVLFVTAREPRRFMDSQHRRYLRTSLEVGEQTAFPWRIAVIRQRPAGPRKEIEP